MRLAAILVLLIPAAGCSDGPKLARVSGKVTVDGKAVANLHVSFEPVGSKDNLYPGQASTGITDANGVYTLITVPGGQRGAVVGKHRVRIYVRQEGNSLAEERNATGKAAGPAAPSSRHLPLRFGDESELTHVVPPEGTDKANFEISWK